MGYYFLQPQFQTGNYVTRFVHNDILQLGLDAGIFPMIALAVMIAANIWNKNNTKQNKTILIILLLHSLFDFDLQFSVMFFLLLMCMSEGDQKNYVWRWKGIAGICGSFTLVCIYFSIALVLSHIGMEQAALYLYPSNTSARESLMQKQEGGRDAEILIEDNGMLASVNRSWRQSDIQHQSAVWQQWVIYSDCMGAGCRYKCIDRAGVHGRTGTTRRQRIQSRGHPKLRQRGSSACHSVLMRER